jgi:hypothetical protein
MRAAPSPTRRRQETIMTYRITNAHDIDTPEALGDAYGITYDTREEAEQALADLDWDDDWGDEPELIIVED